ncbi:MAG: periplasmic heavy metal sensor [Paracoccaceae bacterium]
MTTPTPTDAPEAALPPSASPRPSRRWRVLLVLSLALNLLVLGAVLGAVIGHGRSPYMAMRDPGFGPYTEALGRADRAALRRAFADRGGSPIEPATLAAEFLRLAEALRADPFQPQAVADLFQAQRQRGEARMRLGEDLLLQRITAMSPRERQAFADRLEVALQRRFDRGERRWGHHGGG